MYACLYLPLLPDAAVPQPDVLAQIARDFSPRVEVLSDRLVLLDVSGLGRLLGDAPAIGEELRRATADRHLAAHVVIAATRVAAVVVAHARAGLTVVPPGEEAAALAPLSIRLLEAAAQGFSARSAVDRDTSVPVVSLLRRWGLKTLGDLASLPRVALSERLGQDGPFWQRIARGEDIRPLVPGVPEIPFTSSLDLEWPIDGLEPLSFILGRLFDSLCRRLEEDDRAAIGFTLTLQLVTRTAHVRTLALPAPIRDPKVLRTLVLLDLESHPPPAAIDRVTLALDPTPGRIVQYSLLTRPLPQPEQVSTMMARLTAIVGEGRCGAPAMVETHRPGAFEMRPFAPRHEHKGTKTPRHETVDQRIAVRRFRIPIPARVNVDDGRPTRVTTGQRAVVGGVVRVSAGPWRTSGNWWETHESRTPNPESRQFSLGWDREEWDVALADGAVYRIFLDLSRQGWFVEGTMD